MFWKICSNCCEKQTFKKPCDCRRPRGPSGGVSMLKRKILLGVHRNIVFEEKHLVFKHRNLSIDSKITVKLVLLVLRFTWSCWYAFFRCWLQMVVSVARTWKNNWKNERCNVYEQTYSEQKTNGFAEVKEWMQVRGPYSQPSENNAGHTNIQRATQTPNGPHILPDAPPDPPLRFWKSYGLNPQNSVIFNFTSTYFFQNLDVFLKQKCWRFIFMIFQVFQTILTRPANFSHYFNSDWCRKQVWRRFGSQLMTWTSCLWKPHCVSGKPKTEATTTVDFKET